MTTKNTATKIESLLAKRAALDARIGRIKQRSTAQDRKMRIRALLLLGVALEKQMQAQPGSAHMVRKIVLAHLKDREQAAVTNYLFATQPGQPHVES